MTTWIAIVLSTAWLLAAEAALAAPPLSGPRDALEAAVARFMNITQHERAHEVDPAGRVVKIRELVREMFDFDEISRRALARHWASLQREEQAEFVTLFQDLLERAYLAQVESAGGEKITFLGESIDRGGAATVRSTVATRHGAEIPLDYRLHVRDGRWRIYDVIVQGVSFIASYRTQFDRVIRAESYGALRERLQKKAAETAAVQR
jgi:phospholipid transport system substrate-binding protein